MLIEALHVDGFGCLSDLHLDGLRPGLNVLLGPNEAGKTTLHAFVRAVLYGFPDGRTRRNRYAPLAGGAHGGTLRLRGPDGAWAVGRVSVAGARPRLSVTLPDGSAGGDADLTRLLGGHGEDVFASVFAFGIDELHDAASLESVSDRIYSAGVGLGSVSLPDVERGIEELRTRLFRPKGRDYPLNQALRDHDDLQRRIRELRTVAGAYADLQGALAAAREERDGAEAGRREATLRASRLRTLAAAHGDRIRWLGLDREIAALGGPWAIGEDGLARLERLVERSTKADEAAAQAGGRRESVEAALDRLGPPDHVVATHADLLVRLHKRKGGFEDAWDGRSKAAHGLGAAEGELGRLLGELGWDEPTLADPGAAMAALRAAQEGRRSVLRGEVGRRERLSDVRDDCQALREREAERARLPAARPADGADLERLRAIEAELERREDESAAAGRRLEGRRAEAARLARSPAVVAARAELEELREAIGGFRQYADDLPKRVGALEEKERAVAAALAHLGPGWTEAAAGAADTSIPALDAVRGFRDRLAEGRRLAAAARDALDAAIRAEGEARGEVDGAGPGDGGEDAAERGRTARRLVRALSRLGEREGARTDPGLARDVVLVLGIAVTVFTVVHHLCDCVPAAVAAALIAAAAAVFIAVALRRRRARQASVRLAAGRAEAADLAQRLGLDGLPSEDELDALLTRLAGAPLAQDARRRLERRALDREAAEGRLAAANDDLAADLGAWERHLDASGLGAGLRPETALDVLAAVQVCRAAIALRDELRHRVTTITEEMARFRARATPVMERIGAPAGAGDERLLRCLSEAFGSLDTSLESEARAREIEAAIREDEALAADLLGQIGALRDRRAERLEAVDCRDAADLAARVEATLRATAVDAQAAVLRDRIAARLGVGTGPAAPGERTAAEAVAAAAAEWAATTPDALARGLEEARGAAAAFEEDCRRTDERIRAARDVLAQVRRQRALVEGWDEEIRQYAGDAAPVALAAHGQAVPLRDLSAAVEALCARLDRSRQTEATRNGLEAQRRAAQDDEGRLQKAAAVERAALDALLAGAAVGPDDPPAARVEVFRLREAEQRRREGLERERAACRERVERAAGGAERGAFLAELDGGDPAAWGIEAEEADGRAEAWERTRDAGSEKVGAREADIAGVEAEGEMAELLGRREELRASLARLGEEYAVASLAQWLLRCVVQQQERERQPEVVRRAGSVFAGLTAGRYPRLLAPPGERQIDVQDGAGRRKGLGDLSRGTREQLLLALRLAAIEDLGRRAVPMPILMDDVLVNFDPDRARATARTLTDIADADQQVLVFTCHPSTAHLFREVDPEVPVIDLSPGRVQAPVTAA